MSKNGPNSMSAVNKIASDDIDCSKRLDNNDSKSTGIKCQKCQVTPDSEVRRNSQTCPGDKTRADVTAKPNEKKARKTLMSECKIPKSSAKDTTRFRVIREVNSHCANDTSISRITKCSKLLLFTLDELRGELSTSHECHDRVVGLINNVQWLLKDLDQCSGGSDQRSILLEKYNNYRKEYYNIRKNVDINRGSKRSGEKKNVSAKASAKESISCDCEVEIIKSCSCFNDLSEDVTNGRSLNECPGILDVTKLASEGPKQNCKKVTFRKKLMNWLSWLKRYCCFSCSCDISVSCSRLSNRDTV